MPPLTLEQHEEALAFLRPSQLWLRAGEMRGLRGKQGRGLSLPATTGPVAWADAWSQARPHRLSWAALHARVFDIGISVVPHAEGACASYAVRHRRHDGDRRSRNHSSDPIGSLPPCNPRPLNPAGPPLHTVPGTPGTIHHRPSPKPPRNPWPDDR